MFQWSRWLHKKPVPMDICWWLRVHDESTWYWKPLATLSALCHIMRKNTIKNQTVPLIQNPATLPHCATRNLPSCSCMVSVHGWRRGLLWRVSFAERLGIVWKSGVLPIPYQWISRPPNFDKHNIFNEARLLNLLDHSTPISRLAGESEIGDDDRWAEDTQHPFCRFSPMAHQRSRLGHFCSFHVSKDSDFGVSDRQLEEKSQYVWSVWAEYEFLSKRVLQCCSSLMMMMMMMMMLMLMPLLFTFRRRKWLLLGKNVVKRLLAAIQKLWLWRVKWWKCACRIRPGRTPQRRLWTWR